MTVKEQQQQQQQQGDAENTIDTPGPQEITPPPEAVYASQVPVNTDEVAVPVVIDAATVTAAPEEVVVVVGIDSQLGDPSSENARLFSSSITYPGPKTCTVIAPSTLGAGYCFPAKVDGIDFLVKVPEGGVQEGQAFQVPYPNASITTTTETPETGTSPARIEPLSIEQSTRALPHGEDDVMGHWRQPLCECCEVCFTNCMCLYGFFCTPIMLAQVMTRLKLNVIGVYGQDNLRHHTFWWVLSFWIIFMVIFFGLITVPQGSLVILFVFVVYFTIASTNVRSIMRRRYDIGTECCTSCDGVVDDCCTSLWCAPCSVIQMARHTHDMKKYPYACCSKTGGTPEVV